MVNEEHRDVADTDRGDGSAAVIVLVVLVLLSMIWMMKLPENDA